MNPNQEEETLPQEEMPENTMNNVDSPEPEDTASPELPPLMDADGAFAPEWYKRFEALSPYEATLAKFRRPEALAKSYAHLERLKGYPAREDEGRMAAFREAMGLPASAEEFSIERPENIPDELWNPELVSSLSQVAYEYGVPPKAMAALTERYAEEGRRFVKEMQLREEEQAAEAEAVLQEEWGSRYESNMNKISAFLHAMGQQAGLDASALMADPSLRANPDFSRIMLAAASQMQEAPLRTGEPMSNRQEAHRIAHDPSHPLHEAYMRTSHPQHRYANEQYDRLAFGQH